MWNFFSKKERIFNIAMVGFVGVISILQFYAAVDVYKAKNLIPLSQKVTPEIYKKVAGMSGISVSSKEELEKQLLEDETREIAKKRLE